MLTRRTAILTIGSAIGAGAEVLSPEPPAGPGSGMPFLAPARDGGALLSWLEPLSADRYSLRVARWAGGVWSAAREIATGDNWFINWADYPSVMEMESGTLLAHWLDKVGKGSYGYGIRVARAEGWNAKWQETFFAPPNDPKDYSGFLSFTRTQKGAAAVYLAPPTADAGAVSHPSEHSEHGGGEQEHRKTLRFVEFDSAGRVTGDRELDQDTCSCCQTSVVASGKSLAVAYRDHLPGEIRDISFVRGNGKQWTKPQPLHHDGWVIDGCPTDGPSLASKGDVVGAAWLTRAEGTAKVQLKISSDGGTRFTAALRLDEGNPLGRPAATMLGSDLLVTWLEKTKSGAEIRLRRVTPDGRLQKSRAVAPVPSSRTTGFPRVLVCGDRVLLAWRDGRVRFVTLDSATVD